MANVKQAERPDEIKQTDAGMATAAARPAPAGDLMKELKVTGHMMALPPGLFCIVNETNPGAARSGGLPGVRISPPPVNAQNVEIAGFRSDGWLGPEGDAILVRVRRGPAQVLVTIYERPGPAEFAPKLQVRQLQAEAGPLASVAQTEVSPAREVMDLLAHIQTRGDVGAKFGDWLGERASGNWIEGFGISAPEGIKPADLSYQAVLGRGWLSPWVEAGAYCGSRGMALPLLGLRVRLTGEAAEQYDISVSATFLGGATAGPVGNDETCEATELAPLEAIMVTISPRGRRPLRSRR